MLSTIVLSSFIFTANVTAPTERTDGTPIDESEYKAFCITMVLVDTGDRRSAQSNELCKPASEFFKPWIVAPNWWRDTRPLYDNDLNRNEIGRATVGDKCGEFVAASSSGKEWRVYGQGVTLCTK